MEFRRRELGKVKHSCSARPPTGLAGTSMSPLLRIRRTHVRSFHYTECSAGLEIGATPIAPPLRLCSETQSQLPSDRRPGPEILLPAAHASYIHPCRVDKPVYGTAGTPVRPRSKTA